MKRLRGLLFADPAIVLATVLFGLASLVVSFFDKTGRVQAGLARSWAKTLLLVSGVSVKVEGLENIDPAGSYVFISNHLSYMDTPVVLGYIPVQFRFLAKRGLFKIPLLGTHLGRAGHIPVPREDPRGSVKSMQQAAVVIKEKKISLLIFPEGGRSRDGKLRPFKEGGAYIGIRAGVPLVPIALIGTRQVLPYGAGVVTPGEVTLRILKPIATAGLTVKAREAVTNQLRSLILDEVQASEPADVAQTQPVQALN